VSDFKLAIEQAGHEGIDADVKALNAELKKAEAALKRSKTKDYYKILGECRGVGCARCVCLFMFPQVYIGSVPNLRSKKHTEERVSSTTQTR